MQPAPAPPQPQMPATFVPPHQLFSQRDDGVLSMLGESPSEWRGGAVLGRAMCWRPARSAMLLLLHGSLATLNIIECMKLECHHCFQAMLHLQSTHARPNSSPRKCTPTHQHAFHPMSQSQAQRSSVTGCATATLS
jgi:hypothetical protein